MFSYEYCEIFMNTFSDRTSPVAASVNLSNLEQVRLMRLRLRDTSPSIFSWQWEKDLSKLSLIKQTCSWLDKFIIF